MQLEQTLKQIQASKSKLENLDVETKTEKEKMRALLQEFETVTAEIRSIAGIADPHSKKWTPEAIISREIKKAITNAQKKGESRACAKKAALDTANKNAQKYSIKVSPEHLAKLDQLLTKEYK